MNSIILRRLAALESRQAPSADDGVLDRINKQLDLIAARLRASAHNEEPTPEQLAEYRRNIAEAVRLHGTRQ
jgi:hypothetical protein